MRKIILCALLTVILSCTAEEFQEKSLNLDAKAIRFTLNKVDYFLTTYHVMLHPSNSNLRVIEAPFDNDSKLIRISVIVEETNEIEEFVFIDGETQYISDPFQEEGTETSITKHTEVEMVGTFRVIIEDANGRPQFSFTNGSIDINY